MLAMCSQIIMCYNILVVTKKRRKANQIEMEENTAYGPIGSTGAHPTATAKAKAQDPVYEQLDFSSKKFRMTHNTLYGELGLKNK